MKKFMPVLVLLLFTISIATSAQPQQPPKAQILKPVFVVEDIVFVFQALDNVEISGSEADAFLEVKSVLKSSIQTIQQTAKQPTETMQVEINFVTAQNLITFLQRAKFTGRNAELYKRFVDAMVESSKNLGK